MSRHDHKSARLVVYDLDGVVTKRDTFAALLTTRLRASPLRLLRAAPWLVVWAMRRDPERRAAAARRIAVIGLATMREADYAELASRLGDRIGADSACLRLDVVERMREQKRDGACVVVATATEVRLAEALLRRAGVPFDLLSASILAETPEGMHLVDHRVGQRKAEALCEAGVRLSEAEFITDSATDLPTARLSGHVTLVGAGGRTRASFAREGIRFEAFGE